MALVNRWPLTDKTTVYDVVNGLTLTNNNGVLFSAIGGASIIKASSQSLTFTKTYTPTASLSIWIKGLTDFASPCVIFGNNTGSNSNSFMLYIQSANIGGYVGGYQLNTLIADAAHFPVASWTLLNVTKNSTSGGVVYLNGAQIASGSSGNTITNTANGMGLGNTLNGNVIDARIYDHVLSAGEVVAIYARGPWPYIQTPNDGVYNGTFSWVSMPEIDRKHQSFSYTTE